MRLSQTDFYSKWNDRFGDNDTFTINEGDLREFKDDILHSFILQGQAAPQFVAEDHAYAVGELFVYQLSDDVEGLFWVKAATSTYVNPVPTGLASDPNYVLLSSTAPALPVYDAAHPYVVEETIKYNPGSIGSGSMSRLFEALQAGLLPAPLNANGTLNSNWKEVSAAGAAYAPIVALGRERMLELLEGEGGEVSAGTRYYVGAGAGPGTAVLVWGVGPGKVEADGYLIIPATYEVPVDTYTRARINLATSYAEPVGTEAVTRAALVSRFAVTPPIVGKTYRITRTGGIVEAIFNNVSGWTAGTHAAGTLVSETASIPGTAGIGRYDLVADTFTLTGATTPGGAGDWVAGPQVKGQLSTDTTNGKVYRAKVALTNSLTNPAANPGYYALVGPIDLPASTDGLPEGATNKYFSQVLAIGSLLAGYAKSPTNRVLAATDSILVAFGVLEKRLDDNTAKIGAAPLTTTATDLSAAVNELNAGKQAKDVYSSLAYAASIALDFNADSARTLVLGGNVTFAAATNKAAGKVKRLRIICDGTARTLAFPSSWVFMGTAPTSIAAGKTGVLSLECWGAGETDILAGYTVQA
jgi:hypothetical protein